MEKEFGIKVVSNNCGILPHTLRIWEQRYQIFNPKRSQNGQRVYDEKDLKKAILLAKLIDGGHSISSLTKYSITELKEMADILNNKGNPQKVDNSIIINNLIKYIADYKLDKVTIELHQLRLSMGVNDFVFKIVLPVMRDVGMMVAKKNYTVTQEHIISFLITRELSQIDLPQVNFNNKEIALATPEGNLHELSLIIADTICRANRVSTKYLGVAHPAESLAKAIDALKCTHLLLGVLTSDQWDYQKEIIPYLNAIDKNIDQDLIVILGGGSSIKLPVFKNIIGVNIISTLEDFNTYLGEIY